MSHVMNVVETVNYDQAKEHKEWINSMDDEYDSLMKNQTWKLVELPKTKSLLEANGCINLNLKHMVRLINIRQD
jgi:hypothetical protein